MPNKLEQALQALAKVEAHMETLTPDAGPLQAERPTSGRASPRPVVTQSRGNIMPNADLPPMSTFPASADLIPTA